MDRSAQKVFIKPMKDLGFGRMRENDVAIVVIQIFDLIFLKAARRAKVEVAGVLIPEGAVFNFRPLPPVGGTFEVFLAEMGFCQGAKVLLEGGEGAVLL
jgi:hypothetical protein